LQNIINTSKLLENCRGMKHCVVIVVFVVFNLVKLNNSFFI